jgi:glycerol-3-phosphate acyltransferase PlsX
MLRIAIDAMGGDDAPRSIVAGALDSARRLSLDLVLVGRRAAIEPELARRQDARGGVEVVEADEVVEMGEAPGDALRRKPRASIRVAAELVAAGRADALFSAGNTGATVLAAHAAFGMLPHVDRPALATPIPTRGRPAVLLDVGANAECRPAHLVQFAVMGSVYARLALGAERPRVGLLSIGEEETKGNDLTREAHRLLKAAPIDFIGNVEARDVYAGEADVIVCDGFTGNIAIKISESLVEMVEGFLREELASPGGARRAPLSVGRAISRIRRRVDYSEYGGAPLVGVAGLAVVGHGRSSVKAVSHAVAVAARCAGEGFVARVEQEIAATAAPGAVDGSRSQESRVPGGS